MATLDEEYEALVALGIPHVRIRYADLEELLMKAPIRNSHHHPSQGPLRYASGH